MVVIESNSRNSSSYNTQLSSQQLRTEAMLEFWFHFRKCTSLIPATAYLIRSLCPTSPTCPLCLLSSCPVSCAPPPPGVCSCRPWGTRGLAGVCQSCWCVLGRGSPARSTWCDIARLCRGHKNTSLNHDLNHVTALAMQALGNTERTPKPKGTPKRWSILLYWRHYSILETTLTFPS